MRTAIVTALLLALIADASASAQPAGPRQFLTKAIKGDNSEMRLGALAQARGASREARDFGRMLSVDHADARRQAAPLARRLGVTPPRGMAPEAEREYRKLSRMRGAAFDREFAAYMVNDHEKDIADFRAEANGAGPTADLARQTIPVLEKHLQTARRLAESRR